MASITLRTDDITGETLPDDTPSTRIYIEDAREHISVEIDLSDTSFKGLLKALGKFTEKSRAILPPEKGKPAQANTEAAEARRWALAHRPDLEVKERGAVPKNVILAFRAAMAGEGATDTNPPTTTES